MIQTRKEFKAWINDNWPNISTKPRSSLWIPERAAGVVHCRWFVTVKPVHASQRTDSYWTWCEQTLQGHIRCFYSDPDNERECWGFTDYEDIAWWVLKWGA